MTVDTTIADNKSWLEPRFRSAFWMVVSCLCAALSATATYKSQLLEPLYSPLVASFVRVLANPVWMVVMGVLVNGRQFLSFKMKEPNSTSKRILLIAWGLSGAVTVTTFFWSLKMIGAGPAAFLSSISGIITALCAPYLFGTRKSFYVPIAALFAVAGCLLLRNPFAVEANYLGWIVGAVSGFAGGVAYLILSMLRNSVSTSTIMAYWTGCCLPFHLAVFAFFPPAIPHLLTTWYFVIGGGLAMAGAQFFLARSFATGDPIVLGILTYLAPLFTLCLDMVFFDKSYSTYQYSGALLIITGGVIVVLEKKFRANI